LDYHFYMDINIQSMVIQDYPEVAALWQVTPGMGLSNADRLESIEAYLKRNPGLSCVAREEGQLVGAVLCGHDGRRGLIHHLAVIPSYRKKQVGRRLVESCLSGLAEAGIEKCHIFVYADNTEAISFWKRIGWVERTELVIMSRDIQI
jgi:ribosomal protein S18 acetylase RimI-like enzyme